MCWCLCVISQAAPSPYMRLYFSLLLSCLFISIFCNAQLTITTDSVIQTGTCAGSSLIVRYKTTGGSFGAGNRFTAQLSNAFGQFTAPIAIGTSNFNVGIILATLPKNAQFGFLYRVRVVSSNPAIIGSQSPNTVLVTSTALTATISTPDGPTLCPDDSIRLQAFLPNASYQWSTGANTQTIKVGQTGSYWVKVTDPLGCDARDTIEISSKPNCIFNNNILSIYPNPVSANKAVTIRGVPVGYKVHFIDFSGRIVASVPVGSNSQVQLPGTLSAGTYYIVVQKDNERTSIGKLLILD